MPLISSATRITLGGELRLLAAEKGLKKAAVYAGAKINHRTLDKIYDGEEVRDEKLQKVCRFLGVELKQLLARVRVKEIGERSNITQESASGAEVETLDTHPLNRQSIAVLFCTQLAEHLDAPAASDMVGKTIAEAHKILQDKNPDLEFDEIRRIARNARIFAFDSKYGNRGTEGDERFYDIERWREEFHEILRLVGTPNLSTISAVSVGCGSGSEGIGIYDTFKHLMAVDLSGAALIRFNQHFKPDRLVQCEAEDVGLPVGTTFDLYLSLRVYSSSLFDPLGAIQEAWRLLNPDGRAVISVPTKYLIPTHGLLLDGLARPSLAYHKPDKCYPFELLQDWLQIMTRQGFEDVRINCNFVEAFLTGVRPDWANAG